MSFNEDHTEVTKNLADRFAEDERNISTATTNITAVKTEIENARG